jgi:hypothetical protein
MSRTGPKPPSQVGNRFGQILVLAPTERRSAVGTKGVTSPLWLCRCDCGVEFETSTHLLKSGRVSCGCLKKPRDLVGKRFDRLVVVRLSSTKGRDPLWECQCDCQPEGRTINVVQYALLGGNTKSCGCLKREGNNKKYPAGHGGRTEILLHYRHNAKIRGIEWALTDVEFYALVESVCYYCGAKPSGRSSRGWGLFLYTGIDRRENATGYTAANSVPCCGRCNMAKRAHSDVEFIAHIERQYLHLVSVGLIAKLP